MEFGPVAIADAEGTILAHSVELRDGRLRKGVQLDASHIDKLRASGMQDVVVARLGPEDIHEDEAAERLARALVPDAALAGLRLSKAATGRVNLYSDVMGVVQIDVAKINQINMVDPMITIATVPEWQRMGQGGMVATVKIISYGVTGAALEQACQKAQAALSMRPTAIHQTHLIQTVAGSDDGSKGHRAVLKRVEALGAAMGKTVVPHDVSALAAELAACPAEAIFILTGSATSDIHDVAPEALRQAGGEVHHFGMPVDPGNLLFLGALDGRPVIGLPGCARSPSLNGADWVMERVLCGVPVISADIQAMGVGGLLKEIPQRGRLREQK